MDKNNSAITPECTALLERVRQAKRLYKLSVQIIANEAGMFRPTVQNQLYGRYNLDIRVVLAVARLCPDVSCDWLLRGEGDIIKGAAAPSDRTLLYEDSITSIDTRLQNIEKLLTDRVKAT